MGVYDEIAKSEMHEPGGDLSVWIYDPAAWSGRNARGPVGHHQIRAGSDVAVDFDKTINEIKSRDLRNTHGERKSVQDWPHHTQPKCFENKIYITLLFGLGTRCWACGTINFPHANPMRREEKPQAISGGRCRFDTMYSHRAGAFRIQAHHDIIFPRFCPRHCLFTPVPGIEAPNPPICAQHSSTMLVTHRSADTIIKRSGLFYHQPFLPSSPRMLNEKECSHYRQPG